MKNLEDIPRPDIIQSLEDDKSKFIGTFDYNKYQITRAYLTGEGVQIKLYYQKFIDTSKPVKASICLIHGFGEHSGRFLKMALYLVNYGYEIHMLDLRGFGHSGGTRCVTSLQELHSDIFTLIKQTDSNLPLFLYGHSMGGALVLSFVLQNKHLNFAGIITTSAMIGMPESAKLTWFKKQLGLSVADDLEDLVCNGMISATTLSKNNYDVIKICNDPNVLPFIGLKMAKQFLILTDYLQKNAKTFSHPLLMIHGKLDTVISYKFTQQFFNQVLSKKKKLKIFDYGYHELQNDMEAETLKKDIIGFCNEQINSDQPQKLGNNQLKLNNISILNNLKENLKM